MTWPQVERGLSAYSMGRMQHVLSGLVFYWFESVKVELISVALGFLPKLHLIVSSKPFDYPVIVSLRSRFQITAVCKSNDTI
jgi:hypothetical protein